MKTVVLLQCFLIVTVALAADEAARRDVLKTRAERRAYDGAPPVIPHEIDPRTANDCLDCHGPGDVEAPKMPHRVLTNCTQCHLPQEPSGLKAAAPLRAPLAGSGFEGLRPPLFGSRASPKAPQTIPHSTLMRQNCLNCHGPQGPENLRTPHPDRKNCTQCHLPSSQLDQHPSVPASAATR